MKYYVDTSAIVAALAEETDSDRVWRWMQSCDADQICVSAWVAAEVSAALAMKIRTRALTLGQRAEALATWRTLLATNLTALEISPGCFDAAAAFADRHDLNLRAGDALHLAIAAESGCTVVTLDKIMAEAAPHLGVPVAPI